MGDTHPSRTYSSTSSPPSHRLSSLEYLSDTLPRVLDVLGFRIGSFPCPQLPSDHRVLSSSRSTPLSHRSVGNDTHDRDGVTSVSEMVLVRDYRGRRNGVFEIYVSGSLRRLTDSVDLVSGSPRRLTDWVNLGYWSRRTGPVKGSSSQFVTT